MDRIEEYYNKYLLLVPEVKAELRHLYNIYKEAEAIDSSMGWETDDSVCEEACQNLVKAEEALAHALVEQVGEYSWVDEDKIWKRIFEGTN